MKRNLELELHVWKEVMDLLENDYNKTNNYDEKEELTKQIIEAHKKIVDLQQELHQLHKQKLSNQIS